MVPDTGNVIQTMYISSPNIAVVKYWGKRDEERNIPKNSSLSLTINHEEMNTKTTVKLYTQQHRNGVHLFINNTEVNLDFECRVMRVVKKARLARQEIETQKPGLPIINDCNIVIESFSNFPIGAGLASSASGFSALASCLVDLYQLNEENNPSTSVYELSIIGSGSSVRSLMGGYIEWDSEVSIAKKGIIKKLFTANHWDLCIVAVIVNDSMKKSSSTAGMNETVKTSSLYVSRPTIARKRLDVIVDAINSRDFNAFALVTMMESNTLHALCLDTFPPIFYLSNVSIDIISTINSFNGITVNNKNPINPCFGGFRAAYTFDAGPNAFLFCEKHNLNELISTLLYKYGQSSLDNTDILSGKINNYVYADPPNKESYGEKMPGSVSKIIVTNVSKNGCHKAVEDS